MNSIIAGFRRKRQQHLWLSAVVAVVYCVVVIISLGVDNRVFADCLVGAGIVVVAYTISVAYVLLRYGERRERGK